MTFYASAMGAQATEKTGITSPTQAISRSSSTQSQAAPESFGSTDVSGKSTANAPKARVAQEVQITGDRTWVDSGLDVKPGERLVIASSGKLRYLDAATENGPEGLGRGFKDLLRVLPFNAAGRGAVVGRIGDQDSSETFLIGTKKEMTATQGGRLWVGINQTDRDTGDGTYTVRLEIYAADAATSFSPVRQVKSLGGVDNALFAKIPRRIADKDKNPGDMVNFLILGSQTAMEQTFNAAGWVKVDTDVTNTIVHGIIESIAKESYLTMPMSALYLFDRAQDYGWAHAEPIHVVASRNHLRLWKAPFTVKGETLWVGAATHDIGFEVDQRTDGLTHKIDPDIDLERDYVEKTLTNTGMVEETMHFLPDKPLKEAKTATGGTFHSSGEVLVMKLRDVQDAPAPTASKGALNGLVNSW
ncbi:MAG: hypothetical protein NVS9B4_14370 [Candidatus Acidiferrum sp.]